MGHRLQVAARGAHHGPARHPGLHRAHRARPPRSRCSSRSSSAAPPSAWRRCTTRTRSATRTCAPATPSSCARPATSSPRWSARCSSCVPRGWPSGSSPRCARRAGTRWSAPRARRSTCASTPPARRSAGRPCRTSRPAARWTSTASASSRSPASWSWASSRTWPTSTRWTSSASPSCPGYKDASIANLRDAIEASRHAPAGQPAVRAQHRAPGRCGGRGAGSGARQPARRSWRPRSTTSPRSTASARSSRESVHDWFADQGNRDLVDRLVAAGVNTTGPERSVLPQTLAGQAVVVTGIGARLQPRRGRRGHQGPRRQVARQRLEEDLRPRGRRRARRRPSSPRPPTWACPWSRPTRSNSCSTPASFPRKGPPDGGRRSHLRLRRGLRRLPVHRGAGRRGRHGRRSRRHGRHGVRSLRPGHRPRLAPTRTGRDHPRGRPRGDHRRVARRRRSPSWTPSSCSWRSAVAVCAPRWSSSAGRCAPRASPRAADQQRRPSSPPSGGRCCPSTSSSTTSSTRPRWACASPTPASTSCRWSASVPPPNARRSSTTHLATSRALVAAACRQCSSVRIPATSRPPSRRSATLRD